MIIIRTDLHIYYRFTDIHIFVYINIDLNYNISMMIYPLELLKCNSKKAYLKF